MLRHWIVGFVLVYCAYAFSTAYIPKTLDEVIQLQALRENEKVSSSLADIESVKHEWENYWKNKEIFEPSVHSNHTTPEQIHLSLGNRSANACCYNVMWITKYNSAGPAIVQYSYNPNNISMYSQTGETYTYEAGVLGWSGWISWVVVCNLNYDSRVYYQVGNGNGSPWSGIYNFSTLPVSPTSAINKFAVYGDMGTIMPLGFAVTNQIIKNINKNGMYDAFIHVGDLAYAGTGSGLEWEEIWDLWENQIQPLAAYAPYMTTVGNHESFYNFTAFRARFKMPGNFSGGEGSFYFSFDYGNVHFTSMCTEDYAFPYCPGSPQYAWLEQDLQKANSNRDKTPWLVVLGHRPMYSSDSQTDSGDLQECIESLMLKYQVDLNIAGHMHEYERTYPVYNNTPTQTPKGNPPIYLNPNSTTYLTIGTAGAMILEKWDEPEPVWSAFRKEKYGYGELVIYNSTHLQFNFLERDSDTVLDTFWIQKN